MREIDSRSIRILFDMQACQTAGSAHRGVGRYSRALFQAMVDVAAPREIHTLGSQQHPHPLALDDFPENRQHFVPSLPDWKTVRDFDGGEQDSLDAAALSVVIDGINSDVVHISHLFEGYADRVALPFSSSRPVGRLLSATLYDLIPLRFSKNYFHDERFKRWYLQRVQWLRQADLLLSISESSRQDAIDLLGLDPSRIVTIHGGISAHFKPIANPDGARARLAAQYGITRRRFILYTGGDDHRKNLQGAIEAYAALPSATRRDTQLVIPCAIEPHRKEMYLNPARKFGVDGNDILFVGFVPEEDLVALYATCDVFVFPSLYEGLGLPVLEAMACGAPVVGGNNSSIRELIPEGDALFDATKPSAIAESVHRVLMDTSFADRLRHQGLAQARRFTWDRTARAALEAFDSALRRKREAGTRAAATGWIKRKRLAIFTPLPPCRSGIADYNALFLPFLAEHFDIDLYVDGYKVSDVALNAAFRIFDAKDFRASASAYDAILYEFGNSEFHVHMLPLLAEFPGVVGLHDAFLSGLMGYLEFNLGERDRYAREMLDAHAGQARRMMAPVAAHPNAIGATMVDLPCIKRVLDQAIGIISHSPFNLKIAREFHPEGWPAPYRIISQMAPTPERWTIERMQKTRENLGYAPEDFLIATFGHVAWTKCGDRLLDAFLTSLLATDQRCHLVFAGELAKDDFGLALNDRIRKTGLGQRIKITGFLSEDDYARYLRIADVAVQLRTKSRGGTPKGVLDCLAYGVPVVVNEEASYEDYPDDVVIKLPADPLAADIATALVMLRNDPDQRRAIAERGYEYVRKHHDPKLCAAQYAAAIAEFTSRHAATQAENHSSNLAPHLAGCPNPIHAAATAANFIDSCRSPTFARPCLLIDVSHIAKDDHGTGVPRVVRETVRAAYCSGRPGFKAVAAELVGEDLMEAKTWLDHQRLLLPFEVNETSNAPLVFRPGDHLLMLDSSWARYTDFAPVFALARNARVPITTAVFDLLPVTLPPGNIVPGGKEWFETWLRTTIEASDGIVCISKAVADDLIAYITQHNLVRSGLKIGYWHLGANIGATSECAMDSPVRRVPKPYALMVGTIEPRKNHALALDAFERLWQQGSDLSLVIAGRPGWMVEALLDRLRHHELRNKKFFFFEGVADKEMAYLYSNAAALLFVSKGEGFGLPLVEASQYGTPIVCSDIPTFREIAGQHATYVQIKDAAQLAAEIADWWRRMAAGEVLSSGDMPRLSWEQSAEALMDVVLEHQWYWRS
jgi:glycosyltransferase involved in cell wall biosynthesis